MSRISMFLAGVAVGGALVFTSLKYHVVRAEDGVHLVPKVSAQFAEAYVDIRTFEVSDWNDHRGLAAALVQADKGHLLQEAANSGLRNSLNSVLDTLNGGPSSGVQ